MYWTVMQEERLHGAGGSSLHHKLLLQVFAN